jgi:hypothetical protein
MDNSTIIIISSAITGVCTVAGSGLVGYFALAASKNKEREAELVRDVNRLKEELVDSYRQIASYHTLEDEYSTEIEALSQGSKKKQQVKIEFRDKVVDRNFDRPKFSANEALKQIEKVK